MNITQTRVILSHDLPLQIIHNHLAPDATPSSRTLHPMTFLPV